MFSKLFNFITRHLVWVLLIAFGAIFLMIYYKQFFWQYIAVLQMCAIAEGMALALSSLATWAFTSIPFAKKLAEGEDKKISDTERIGLLAVVAAIFVGVHIMIGIIIGGLYIAQFN
jgi:ABC-type nickel/cobalt efflux system permease component RcnA